MLLFKDVKVTKLTLGRCGVCVNSVCNIRYFEVEWRMTHGSF